ncbi:MAG: hypothetical protein QOG03_1948 [Actinomycetota bacterium]|nr:hypothetical protein [Actinomycetota bacterium]
MSKIFDEQWTAIDDAAFEDLVHEGRLDGEEVAAASAAITAMLDEPWDGLYRAAPTSPWGRMSNRRKLVLLLLVTGLTIALMVMFSTAAGASAAGHCGGF